MEGSWVCGIVLLLALGNATVLTSACFNDVVNEVPDHLQNYPEKYYEFQKLDHFNGADTRKWRQRYFVNDTYHKPGGPIFLALGGEREVNPRWMVEGAWLDYARMHDAIFVFLEHRYYGKSRPVPDLSATNLQYLSSQQALADIARFIQVFRLTNDLMNNKLVTFGCSYGGSLSAWFRSKYPDMSDGAVASSAPIVAKFDFKEYLEVATASLNTTGAKCAANVKNATMTMYEWWGQPLKRVKMRQMFRLCDVIDNNNTLDFAGFFKNIATFFGAVVKNNNNARADPTSTTGNITIQRLCNIMNDESRGSQIQRYADVSSMMLELLSEDCYDYTYKKLVRKMRQTDWNSSVADGERQFMYQQCAEFGWSLSSGGKQPFGLWFIFPYNFTSDQCIDMYDQAFIHMQTEENVESTNLYYGGRNMPVSKVVFPNGSLDPWHALSFTEDVGSDVTAIYIDGTSHCTDMYPGRDDDPASLVAARHRISELIGKWVA